ncbi:hypothetical protein S83_062451 [Arachis hypogaea]
MPLGSHSRSHPPPPKCQHLEASRIFERLGIALSSSMAKQNLRQAIDFLYSCGLATSDSYMCHVLFCVRANDFVQAKRLQSHMQLHLFQPKVSFIHNHQHLHLFTKCGKLSYARDLFDNMTHRDIYSWNSLLSAYAKLGLVEDLCTV